MEVPKPRRRSRHVLVVAFVVAMMSLVSAVGSLRPSQGTAAANLQSVDESHHVTIQIRDLSGSGVSGKATLRADGDVTTIGIRISGDAAAYPTHLHEGTCDDFEAMPGAPLADSTSGSTSRTTVEMPLDELLSGSWVINIHHPEQHLNGLLDPASVIACGDITDKSVPTDEAEDDVVTTTTKPPATGVGSTITRHSSPMLTFSLSFLAIVITGIAVALRRSEQRNWVPYPV